ncbi:sensor histidine kinase [Dyella silvatica]|uniref:sensor histidine kinase n=1 Tax=Dyella silvatica TaxID=2992128 RepID=UPI00225112E0|nr:histidine kinase [Dyella silvatica]
MNRHFSIRPDSLPGQLRSPMYLRWQVVVSQLWLMALLPSWRHWLTGLALIALLIVLMSLYLRVPVWLMLLVLMGSILSGISHFLYLRNLRKDAELRLSQEEVRRLAVLAERERIGRDLHDLPGHTWSLVALKSELARRLALSDPPRAQQDMEEVERVVRHALGEVRAAVTGMLRGDLATELVPARLMLEACHMTFEDDMPATLVLPAAVEAPLALVLREAMTKIHRHARASAASVQFSIEGARFGMCIRDNGCGGVEAHGNGISGMRERIRALQGTLDIDSPSRRGSLPRISVPLSESSSSFVVVPSVMLSANRSAA